MAALDDTVHALLAALEYPMFIVTTAAGEERSGCLVGFAAQCSIDPTRLMVWLSKNNHTYCVAVRAEALAVHLPDAGQAALAALFGGETGDEVDKFESCRWRPGLLGVPILDDCTRWLVGRVLERVDTGDHVGFLLEPVDAAAGPWSGQLGFQAVRDLEPGHEA